MNYLNIWQLKILFFEALVWLNLGLNPSLPDHWWTLYSLGQWPGNTNGPGDLGSIPGHVIPKTFKIALDTSLFNTQQYKVGIKGKVEQSRERNSALPQHLDVVAIKNGTYWSLSTKGRQLYLTINFYSSLHLCRTGWVRLKFGYDFM